MKIYAKMSVMSPSEQAICITYAAENVKVNRCNSFLDLVFVTIFVLTWSGSDIFVFDNFSLSFGRWFKL